MADASLQQVFLDRPLHEVVVDARLRDALEVLNRLVVVSLKSSEIADLEEQLVRQPASIVNQWSVRKPGGKNSRFGIVLLVPAGSGLVCLHSALLVAKFNLEQLRNVLLPCSRPPEVALHSIVIDGDVEATSGILRVRLPVRLEGLGHGVRRVIGLVQVVLLDRSGALKRQTGLLACAKQFLSDVRSRPGRAAGFSSPCFCILKAFAAWMYSSAAFSYFS